MSGLKPAACVGDETTMPKDPNSKIHPPGNKLKYSLFLGGAASPMRPSPPYKVETNTRRTTQTKSSAGPRQNSHSTLYMGRRGYTTLRKKTVLKFVAWLRESSGDNTVEALVTIPRLRNFAVANQPWACKYRPTDWGRVMSKKGWGQDGRGKGRRGARRGGMGR